jgi:transcriptional regulator with XRE-family HTH domain
MTSAYEQGSVPPIEVKHRLRIAREFAGLDQEQLAARSGISRAAISNAETGHGTPRRTTLNAWALATGVPVSWITSGTTSPDGAGGVGAPTPTRTEDLRIISQSDCPFVSVTPLAA